MAKQQYVTIDETWVPLGGTGGGGAGFMGDWDALTEYPAGSVVTHAGATWGTEAGAAPGALAPGEAGLFASLIPTATDAAAGAPALVVGSPADASSVLFSNAAFGSEAGEPDGARAPRGKNRSGWLKYLPLASGTVAFSTVGSTGDTLLGMYRYTGSPTAFSFAGLALIGEDDDGGGGPGASRLQYDVVAGETYYFQIGTYSSGTVCDYQFNIEDGQPTAFTDEINPWIELPVAIAPGHTIQDEGAARAARSKLNFTGSGVTATDDAANDRTNIAVASSSIVEGTWKFTSVQNTAEPLYAPGYIWNRVVGGPQYEQQYMIAVVDKDGTNHTSQFEAVSIGDELQLTWGGVSNARATIRSITKGYSGGSPLTHLILGTGHPTQSAIVPGGPGENQEIRAAIVPQRKFAHGSYLIIQGTTAPYGYLAWNANPQSAPGSVTQLTISATDLGGYQSLLKLAAAPTGSKFRVHLDQGGLAEFTSTGPVPNPTFNATTGSYYTVPVTTASYTGYWGSGGWLEVLPPASAGTTPSSRIITAGPGLTGGGDLSADRTLTIGQGTGITVGDDDIAVDTATIATRAYVDGKPVAAAILSGTATPTGANGITGDYYLDTDDRILYGPKVDAGASEYIEISSDQSFTSTGSNQAMKYRFTVNGYVIGVRFRVGSSAAAAGAFKTYLFPGTTGAALATKDAPAVSANTWVSVMFDGTVAVLAGTTYLVSVWVPSGANAIYSNSFSGQTVGNVRALNEGEDGPQGVGADGTPGLYPGGNAGVGSFSVSPIFSATTPWPVALKSVPPGGTTSQVLAKTSATDYAAAWAPAPVSLQTRATASKATASLAAGASETGTIALAAGYRIYSITCSASCRVRLYTTTAAQSADVARPIGVDPDPGAGLQFEFVSTPGLPSADLSPTVDGFDGKATPDGQIPCTIANMGAGAAVITVWITWVRTE